ncbi:hypothetical protein STANM309S_03782 [Streptomyces tanashiensis]
MSTLRASSATVSDTPYSSRMRACEGRRVCGGSEPLAIFSPQIARHAQIGGLLTERHWTLPSG